MLRRLSDARKQIAAAVPSNKGKPRHERDLGLLGDLELDGPLRLLWIMVARSRIELPDHKSSTFSLTRSQARSLLSMARLKSASSRIAPLISSRTRIDHTFFGCSGRFCPTRIPLFHGYRLRSTAVSMPKPPASPPSGSRTIARLSLCGPRRKSQDVQPVQFMRRLSSS